MDLELGTFLMIVHIQSLECHFQGVNKLRESGKNGAIVGVGTCRQSSQEGA